MNPRYVSPLPIAPTVMPQSLGRGLVYAIFSTKQRRPRIGYGMEAALWAYMAGICNALGCPAVRIGGHLDHLRVLCGLSRSVAIKKLLEEVKQQVDEDKRRGLRRILLAGWVCSLFS